MLPTYMTTCDRAEMTWDVSQLSLIQAGFHPVISSEPGGETAKHAHRTNRGKRGSWPHFIDCLVHAFELTDYWDHVAVFQDDIQICEGLKPWLDDHMPESFGVLSLYTPLCHHTDAAGWLAIPGPDMPRKCYGALAVILERKTGLVLLDCPQYRNGTSKTDLWLGRLCRDLGKPWVYPSTSFVEHIGTISTIDRHADQVDPQFRYASVWYRHVANIPKEWSCSLLPIGL